jgi:hypothetical protein
MRHGQTCASVVVASLIVSGTFLRAAEPIEEVSHEQLADCAPALSSSQSLLAADPGAIAQLLMTARPAPVPDEEKLRALRVLPLEGEITQFSASVRQKLAAVTELLRATGRESVYDIKVIAVPQAAIGLYARAVILISEAALTLLDADELPALVAHEIGHEYVWTERERSFRLADRTRLKDLELVCDGIAIVTLRALGMDVSRLMSGVQKVSRFNRKRFGPANNERDYPTVAQRETFALAMAAR